MLKNFFSLLNQIPLKSRGKWSVTAPVLRSEKLSGAVISMKYLVILAQMLMQNIMSLSEITFLKN